jgi:uncharacterized delta-60 repeat protein
MRPGRAGRVALRRGRGLTAVAAVTAAAVIGALSAATTTRSAAASGAPTSGTAVVTAVDASFGGGFVATSLSDLDDEVFAVATQPDGDTLVAGRTNFDPFQFRGGAVFVARYGNGGILDATFGTGGSVVVDTPATTDRATAIAVQGDGKIVVAAQYADHPAIIRLTAAGGLDPDFQGGIVSVAEAQGSALAVALRADGGIVFGGDNMVVGRLNADGSRDTGFGSNGIVTGTLPSELMGYLVNGTAVVTTAIAILADGGLVVGGYVAAPVFGGGPSDQAFVVRYLPSGQADAAFGHGGVAYTDLDTPYVDRGTQIAALAVQADGKIVATGQAYIFGSPASPPGLPGPPPASSIQHSSLRSVALFRYLPDGSPDTTLAGTGHVITRVPGQTGPGSDDPAASTTPETDSVGLAITLDASGGILIGGWSAEPFPEPLVVRYSPSGLVDTTFGRMGVLSVDRGGVQGRVNAMAFDPDGRLVLAGMARSGWYEAPNYGDVLVGRITPGTSTGTVWAWGWNGVGQLGDGTTTDRHAPVQVRGLSGVVSVSAGPWNTLAVRGDGTVWAWGWNGVGQLGDGTTIDRHTPIQVPGLTGVVAVAAGYYHSLALKGDGTVMAWGWNGVGQLGDGTNQRRLTPAVVPGMNGVISISSGLFHNLALREDGTAWAWGYNGQGQVGDGTTVDRHVPVQLPPNYFNYAYAAVSAGWLHSVSVSDQWEMHSWGWNAVGQVAPPGGGDIPTPDTYLGSAMTISAGGYHNLNVQRDGSVHGNGWNGFGQLGPPGGLSNLTHVSSISAAGLHSLAVTSDGGLWTWGWNNFGQLGTGTTVSGATPTLVATMPNVATAVGGAYHSVATRR